MLDSHINTFFLSMILLFAASFFRSLCANTFLTLSSVCNMFIYDVLLWMSCHRPTMAAILIATVAVYAVLPILPEHWSGKLVWVTCAIGLHRVMQVIFLSARFVFTQFVRRPHDLPKRYGKGTWVVITGGSGGIGLGFAVELAKEGFNICLISRSMENLKIAEMEVLAAASARGHVINTRLIEADFSNASDPTLWEYLKTQLAELDVSILVNNVGVNNTSTYDVVSEKFLMDVSNINCLTQMLMTRLLLPNFLKRSHRSAVISMSSVVGMRPVLYIGPYAASKAFNDFFSRSLSLEFPQKIDFLSVRAGYVMTNMSKLTEKSAFVLDKYECARGCLEKVGYATETYGDPRHAIYSRGYLGLPEYLLALRRRRRLKEKNGKASSPTAIDFIPKEKE